MTCQFKCSRSCFQASGNPEGWARGCGRPEIQNLKGASCAFLLKGVKIMMVWSLFGRRTADFRTPRLILGRQRLILGRQRLILGRRRLKKISPPRTRLKITPPKNNAKTTPTPQKTTPLWCCQIVLCSQKCLLCSFAFHCRKLKFE